MGSKIISLFFPLSNTYYLLYWAVGTDSYLHFLYEMQENKHKAGTFFPFGRGTRLCPGSDLAKLEIYTFLHYFLLDYE